MYSYATFFLNFIFIICASYVHFKTFYVFISMRNVRILCVRASYVHFYAFYVCIFMRNVCILFVRASLVQFYAFYAFANYPEPGGG